MSYFFSDMNLKHCPICKEPQLPNEKYCITCDAIREEKEYQNKVSLAKMGYAVEVD